MKPQDYKITYFEAGNYTDPHGNVWCNVLFDGAQNEQIRMVVKDPKAYSIGQVVYGHIEEKESQAGKSYLRFYRDKKPDYQEGNQAIPSAQKSNYTPNPDQQESIARSVALKAAVDYHVQEDRGVKKVLETANEFLSWLQGSGDKPVKVVEKKEQARPWERVGKPKDEDDPAIERYQRFEEPLPDFPGDE